jgi:hypothetical protein
MDIDEGKQFCGSCKDWKGRRDWVGGKVVVKSSARGMCQRLKKIKPPHGGCDYWQKWEGEKDDG